MNREIEIGSFVRMSCQRMAKEYMVIEMKGNDLYCLQVVDGKWAKGNYVQKAYANKVVIIQKRKIKLGRNNVKEVKARLASRYVQDIIKRYEQYVKYTLVNNGIEKRASADGLRTGNSWEGLSATSNYVKIYRG